MGSKAAPPPPPAAFITLPGSGTVRARTSPSLLPCQGRLSEYVHPRVWEEEEEHRGGEQDGKKRHGRLSSKGGCEDNSDAGIRPGREQTGATVSIEEVEEFIPSFLPMGFCLSRAEKENFILFRLIYLFLNGSIRVFEG